jgi:hypothetical protein
MWALMSVVKNQHRAVKSARTSNFSVRAMHPAQQPTDTKHDECRCVRLGFDCSPKPVIQCFCSIPRSICCLPIEILHCSSSLIDFSFELGPRVAGYRPDTLFDFAANISSRARHAIFVHRSSFWFLLKWAMKERWLKALSSFSVGETMGRAE